MPFERYLRPFGMADAYHEQDAFWRRVRLSAVGLFRHPGPLKI